MRKFVKIGGFLSILALASPISAQSSCDKLKTIIKAGQSDTPFNEIVERQGEERRNTVVTDPRFQVLPFDECRVIDKKDIASRTHTAFECTLTEGGNAPVTEASRAEFTATQTPIFSGLLECMWRDQDWGLTPIREGFIIGNVKESAIFAPHDDLSFTYLGKKSGDAPLDRVVLKLIFATRQTS